VCVARLMGFRSEKASMIRRTGWVLVSDCRRWGHIGKTKGGRWRISKGLTKLYRARVVFESRQ